MPAAGHSAGTPWNISRACLIALIAVLRRYMEVCSDTRRNAALAPEQQRRCDSTSTLTLGAHRATVSRGSKRATTSTIEG